MALFKEAGTATEGVAEAEFGTTTMVDHPVEIKQCQREVESRPGVPLYPIPTFMELGIQHSSGGLYLDDRGGTEP